MQICSGTFKGYHDWGPLHVKVCRTLCVSCMNSIHVTSSHHSPNHDALWAQKCQMKSSLVPGWHWFILKMESPSLTYLYYPNWPTGNQKNCQPSGWIYNLYIGVKADCTAVIPETYIPFCFECILLKTQNPFSMAVNCKNVTLKWGTPPLAVLTLLNVWWTWKVLTLL